MSETEQSIPPPQGGDHRGRAAAKWILSALCLLLVAGGLPWGGTEEVYRGGLMRIVGGVIGVMCLCTAWSCSRGGRWRLVVGMMCLFFTVAGVGILVMFGGKAFSYARLGGAMWFGAAGMGCLALTGLLFSAIFGYLSHLCMRVNLWVAGMHACMALLLIGAFIDYYTEQRIPLTRSVGCPEPSAVDDLPPGIRLPFQVTVSRLHIRRYNAPTEFRLMEHRNGKWLARGRGTLHGTRIVHGKESRELSTLRRIPGGEGCFYVLPGSPLRVFVQQIPPVREYCAECALLPMSRDGETQTVSIRVNEPAKWGDWRIYLMNCSPDRRRVQLLLKRAPGTALVRAGAIGLLLCVCAHFFVPKATAPT